MKFNPISCILQIIILINYLFKKLNSFRFITNLYLENLIFIICLFLGIIMKAFQKIILLEDLFKNYLMICIKGYLNPTINAIFISILNINGRKYQMQSLIIIKIKKNKLKIFINRH